MRCVRKRLLAALLTTSFATFVVASSDAIEPAWSRDFAVPIEWQRVTAFGHLLVETRDGLFAASLQGSLGIDLLLLALLDQKRHAALVVGQRFQVG